MSRHAALVLLLAGFLASSAAAVGATPKTLVVQRAPIEVFAQDGGRIAWVGGRCHEVRIRTLWNGRQAIVGSATSGFEERCGGRGWDDSLVLTLGDRRALWGGFDNLAGNLEPGVVGTGAFGSRPALLEKPSRDVYESDYLAVGGDGPTLVYAIAHVEWLNSDPCDFGEEGCCIVQEIPCEYKVTRGGVRRVVGRSRMRLPGAPPAVLVAASAGRIAVVPADPAVTTSRKPGAAVNGAVQIRDADSGALVTTFSPIGTVEAVALSGRRVAVLVRDQSGKRIETFDASTGLLRGTVPVPAETAKELDIAGRRIVFRVGRAIHLLDLGTGIQSRLWTASARPVGLSIEGRRIAWALTLNGRGRVRAIILS